MGIEIGLWILGVAVFVGLCAWLLAKFPATEATPERLAEQRTPAPGFFASAADVGGPDQAMRLIEGHVQSERAAAQRFAREPSVKTLFHGLEPLFQGLPDNAGGR